MATTTVESAPQNAKLGSATLPSRQNLQDRPINGSTKPGPYKHISSSLPFGQHIKIEDLSGPTYVTCQLVLQHVAYALSERIWTYSADQFELDIAIQHWNRRLRSIKLDRHDDPRISTRDIRHGAGIEILGYLSSQPSQPGESTSIEAQKPQSIMAPSAAFHYVRSVLLEISLNYDKYGPVTVHTLALDYDVTTSRLVSDYVSVQVLAEDIECAVVSNVASYEVSHMALFATILSSLTLTIFVSDGTRLARETFRDVDVPSSEILRRIRQRVLRSQKSTTLAKREAIGPRVTALLEAFNGELGTEYAPFEYHGHAEAETVLVVFGSVECSIASQMAINVEKDQNSVGVINTRIYQPFLADSFIAALPRTVRQIGVLGQVHDRSTTRDPNSKSNLYNQVVMALLHQPGFEESRILDIKYSRHTVWTPPGMQEVFDRLLSQTPSRSSRPANTQGAGKPDDVQQYCFFDTETDRSSNAACIVARALALESARNVSFSTSHDILNQGGMCRSDIRVSRKSMDLPHPIELADLVYIGSICLLDSYDISSLIVTGGKVLVRLPNVRDDGIESKLSVVFRRAISHNRIQLYILDPGRVISIRENPLLEDYLLQVAFLRLARPTLEKVGLEKLSAINGSRRIFDRVARDLDTALRIIEVPESWKEEVSSTTDTLGSAVVPASAFRAIERKKEENVLLLKENLRPQFGLMFPEAFGTAKSLRPDISTRTYTVHVKENKRLTPSTYERNIFHIEFDLGSSGLIYEIGEALGIHAENDVGEVLAFIEFYGLNAEDIVSVPSRENDKVMESRTVYQALLQNIDIFGRPPKKFYEDLGTFASDDKEAIDLFTLASAEGTKEFTRRAEVDTVTYADILLEYASARPSIDEIVRIVSPMKRREYSIASCQKVTPRSVALMIVVVGWTDPRGRDRFGQATRYLRDLRPGQPITVSVKASVMKLPPQSTQPLIMAGLGTGLAPFRAFVQYRAWEKAQGKEIGSVLLYMGSRHQREEYCYGEEWEAYQAAGIITLLGRAFSRDQPEKIYIQDRMRQTMPDIIQAYLEENGVFYLCGPTWPVPDVTNVLEEAIVQHASSGLRGRDGDGHVDGNGDGDRNGIEKSVDPHREIENLKENSRYVLEVY